MTAADDTPTPVRVDEARLTEWRVGEHYGIHVYEGDRPVATFHQAADAAAAVADRAEVRRLWAQVAAVEALCDELTAGDSTTGPGGLIVGRAIAETIRIRLSAAVDNQDQEDHR